jgi:hypothetical protein
MVGTDPIPGRDTVGTDTAGTDTAGTDTAGTDTAGTDTAGTETGGKEAAPAGRARAVRIASPKTMPAIPPRRITSDRAIRCGVAVSPLVVTTSSMEPLYHHVK